MAFISKLGDKMKFLKIFLLLGLVVSLNAGKVTWDSNGNPIIAGSDYPIKGCHQGGLETIVEDKNSSSCG